MPKSIKHVVVAKVLDLGLLPVFYNQNLIGNTNYQVVEAFDHVPGAPSWPLTFVDQYANTFLRLTYQKPSGGTGDLGTSVIGTASFRTPGGLQLIPTVTRGDVVTGGVSRYQGTMQGFFGPQANQQASLLSTRTFPDPPLGLTTANLSISFGALQDIPLATDSIFVGNDRFRTVTLSSMFANSSQFDANIMRYEDVQGTVKTLLLNDSTPRGGHLLAAPDEIGSWLELIKSPGSLWYPDSPSIRLTILDKGGLRWGIQGFLDNSTTPSDDSLSVWLEWLDAPNTIPAATTLNTTFSVSAFAVPEPSSLALLLTAGLAGWGISRRRRCLRSP